tara:strand:+ start:1273 stop:1506 length:234 start_codon:yes stop_codon:yes gene_type:complete
MSTSDKILNAIASTPTPAGEPARELRETRRSMVTQDFRVAATRAEALGVKVEELILILAEIFVDTHVVFLDEESTNE